VKGDFLSKIIYGHDPLTKPLRRKTGGKYDKNGEFTAVSWDEAFDVMAEKFKAALKKRGPSGVGMFGSGQWTIFEGYAASKLFKAGFRSNNIDPNARHCMASAAVGFMRSFGIDEPMGCYDDIEAADAFVLWGSNMAEMHLILWTRVADRRLSAPHVRVAVLSVFEHRSFDLTDIGLVFKPQTDLSAQRHRQPHRQDRAGEQGFCRQAHPVQAWPDRHRLWPPSRASAGKEGNRARQGRRCPGHELRRIRSFPTTRWRKLPTWPAFRSTCWKRSRSSMPTRRSR
jgi:hypothetical protein